MKEFNKTLNIEIEVDAIAQQLLQVVPEDFKHREILVEAIIGHTHENPYKLGSIYQALNGFVKKINFEVGDIVEYQSTFHYTDTPGGERRWQKSKHAVVKSINLFADNGPELNVIHHFVDYSDGKEIAREETSSVPIYHCTKIPAKTE